MNKTNELDCELRVTEARLSPWAELMWPAEWAQLRMSPVYRGVGISHGNGEHVIVVPGFLGSDLVTEEMRRWLGRAGYEAHVSGIGRNVDCPDVSLERLEETVAAIAERSGERTRIVGHSLGGLVARAAAARRPDLVGGVVTLGSPLRGAEARPLVAWLAQTWGRLMPPPSVAPRKHEHHFHSGTCACSLMEALESPFPQSVNRTSIYSRRDGIVDWRACLDTAPGRNVDVNASHLGMLVNKEVFQAVAEALAAPSERQDAVAGPVAASLGRVA